MSELFADFSTHPNDAYFKAVFSQPEHATAFFQEHLPASIAAAIDWASLSPMPTSFVKQTLQQAHSDLLFSAFAGSHQVLLYLIFEHQTTVDTAMPLRLLGYMLNLWQAHEKQHGLPLPPILPFVLHQGPETWTVSAEFVDLLDIPEELTPALLPYLPKFRHGLLDLTRFDPDQEAHQAQIRVVLQLMKMARRKEMLEFFQWLAALPSDLLPTSLLNLSFLYALHVDSRLDVQKIYHTLESNPTLRDKTMSIAEQLKAEGKAEGVTEGVARGVAKGVVQGQLQLLQRLMGLPPTSEAELAAMSVEEIQARFEAAEADYKVRFKRD